MMRQNTPIFFKQQAKIIVTASILVLLFFNGCKKFAEVSPPSSSIVQSNVYLNNQTAVAVLTGIYANMASVQSQGFATGNTGISIMAGLSSDELTLYNMITDPRFIGYYKNALGETTVNTGSEYWNSLYKHIYTCNAAMENLSTATSITETIKRQLLGEAKFMRGFFYFYLTSLFGDVPLALSTDYKVNSLLPRVDQADIYKQIIIDLKDAQLFLSDSFLNGGLNSVTSERVRPTKWAASALLARIYLYTKDWTNAENAASKIIDNRTMFDTTNLNDVFFKNSKESIWQLQPVTVSGTTDDAIAFILNTTPVGPTSSGSRPVHLSPQLISNFEAGDKRGMLGSWINNVTVSGVTYYYPYKYKNNGNNSNEYLMVLRLAEQYLIRAEARAEQNKLIESLSDLNIIRKRAGLMNSFATDKSILLDKILHERQVELFTEWGHRWFDLKRTSQIDQVMNIVTPQKSSGNNWKSFQQFYPLPWNDILLAPNLIQNPGYSR